MATVRISPELRKELSPAAAEAMAADLTQRSNHGRLGIEFGTLVEIDSISVFPYRRPVKDLLSNERGWNYALKDQEFKGSPVLMQAQPNIRNSIINAVMSGKEVTGLGHSYRMNCTVEGEEKVFYANVVTRFTQRTPRPQPQAETEDSAENQAEPATEAAS